jgi:hypothetical protein
MSGLDETRPALPGCIRCGAVAACFRYALDLSPYRVRAHRAARRARPWKRSVRKALTGKRQSKHGSRGSAAEVMLVSCPCRAEGSRWELETSRGRAFTEALRAGLCVTNSAVRKTWSSPGWRLGTACRESGARDGGPDGAFSGSRPDRGGGSEGEGGVSLGDSGPLLPVSLPEVLVSLLCEFLSLAIVIGAQWIGRLVMRRLSG